MTSHTTQVPGDAIASLLGSISLAPRQAHKSLTLWPVVLADTLSAAPHYITLSQAFARGELDIDELKEGATVPHVLATNRGDVAILVLFGEEIRGAKQNRIANASFLLPPLRETVIDVSCVEHGRWSRRRDAAFASTGSIMSSGVRAKMAGRVSKARRDGLGFQADQGEVWSEIGERLRFSRAHAPSGAYADYLSTRQRDLEEIAKVFHPIPGQVGFVASIGDDVAGAEIIGRPEVFAEAFPGLLHGYLIDAVDHALVRELRSPRAEGARFDAPEPFLSALGAARVETSPSLGIGTDLRVESDRVTACALVAGDVVHLTAFPA